MKLLSCHSVKWDSFLAQWQRGVDKELLCGILFCGTESNILKCEVMVCVLMGVWKEETILSSMRSYSLVPHIPHRGDMWANKLLLVEVHFVQGFCFPEFGQVYFVVLYLYIKHCSYYFMVSLTNPMSVHRNTQKYNFN